MNNKYIKKKTHKSLSSFFFKFRLKAVLLLFLYEFTNSFDIKSPFGINLTN